MIPLQTGLLSSPCQLHPGSIFLYFSSRTTVYNRGKLSVCSEGLISWQQSLCATFFDASSRFSMLEFPWFYSSLLLMVALFVCEYNKQIQYNKKKKSHLKVLPFMYCQTQRHLPQIRHERLNSVGSYYVLRGLLVRACVLRARRIISYRQRGVNPPDFSPPHPRPPPLRQPRCQSPHWGDTYHGSGKSSSAATLTEARRDSRGRLGLETVSSSHQILRSIGSRQ